VLRLYTPSIGRYMYYRDNRFYVLDISTLVGQKLAKECSFRSPSWNPKWMKPISIWRKYRIMCIQIIPVTVKMLTVFTIMCVYYQIPITCYGYLILLNNSFFTASSVLSSLRLYCYFVLSVGSITGSYVYPFSAWTNLADDTLIGSSFSLDCVGLYWQ
jgi:hypothetical protein